MVKFLKPVISVFLLLTYLVGFAHNVLPHRHLDDVQEHSHLDTHHHASIEDLDYDDVKHNNHLDDSLLDYVLCLLSEFEHSSVYQVDNHFIVYGKEALSLKKVSFINLFAVVLSFNIEKSPEGVVPKIKESDFFHYLLPHIESFSFRGPPSFSC